MSTTSTFAVNGMTCSHCVSAVDEELRILPGVKDVTIDLVAGGTSTVQVTSHAELDRARVAEAVDEAGYELVETP